jgi:hypothetical protein
MFYKKVTTSPERLTNVVADEADSRNPQITLESKPNPANEWLTSRLSLIRRNFSMTTDGIEEALKGRSTGLHP